MEPYATTANQPGALGSTRPTSSSLISDIHSIIEDIESRLDGVLMPQMPSNSAKELDANGAQLVQDLTVLKNRLLGFMHRISI